jgi:hypothetical protein
MLVRMPAAPPAGMGPVSFMGETGRAKKDFVAPDIAVGGRMGDRGMVRELAERGERTWDGGILREAVRAGGRMASFFARFFGFSTFSFSLSSSDTSSLLLSVKVGCVHVKFTHLGRFRGLCCEGLARACGFCAIALAGDDCLTCVDCIAAILGAPPLCFAKRSPIFAFRSAMGIRFTLISIRVRIPCAWRLYCARSFLARSVTA